MSSQVNDHQHLWQDSDVIVERLKAFLGGDREGVHPAHPGEMLSSIYDTNGESTLVLKSMIDDACSLANRCVMLGPSGDDVPETQSVDDVGASRGRKTARRSSTSIDRGTTYSSDTCPIKHRINRVLETLYYLQQAMKSSMISMRLVNDIVSCSDTMTNTRDEVNISDDEIAAGVERFTRMNVEDANRLQNLLLYLLNTTQTEGFKRNGTDVFRKIYTLDGGDTHAWERLQSIKEFVYESARKEINFDQWLNLTSSAGNASSATEHLTLCCDVQFPTLERDRHVFAFSDGLYLAITDEFIPYKEVSNRVPSTTAACKYFDLPFLDTSHSQTEDWYDIPTPSLQRILDHQDMSPEVCRWMYVLIGRLMYDLNEHDGWQVIPYLMGQAGSGKSSILVKVCRSLYELTDVGVLSNNMEKKFGLAAFANKYIFIAPEIKHDLQLEQAEFQSLVSGESLQLNIKFKTAVTVDWKTPGIMAGNEFPNFKNNSGSIDRRVVVFGFVNAVEKGDMDLGKKLESEMPALIKKANVAYRTMVEKCGRDDVWTHLPSYFKDRRKELAKDTNHLAEFCSDSGELRGQTDSYILVKDFNEHYRTYCVENGYPIKPAKKADFMILRNYFPMFRFEEKCSRTWPMRSGTVVVGSYIVNVGWSRDVEDFLREDEDIDDYGVE